MFFCQFWPVNQVFHFGFHKNSLHPPTISCYYQIVKKTLSEALFQIKLGIKVLKLVFDSSPKWASFYFLSSALNSSVPALSFYIYKLIIDAIIAAAKSPSPENIRLVLAFILLNFLIDTIGSVFGNLSTYGYDACKDIFNKFAISKVLEKSANLDLSFFEDHKFYDQLEKVQRDIYWRPVQVMNTVVDGTSAILGLFPLLFILTRLAFWAPIVIVALYLPRLLFRLKYSYWTYSITSGRSPLHRKVNQIIWLLTHTNPAKEIKIFSLKNYFLNLFGKINDQFIAENRGLAKKQNIYSFLLDFAGQAGYFSLVFFSAIQAIFQKITIGDLTMYIGTIGQFQRVVHGIIIDIAQFYENNLFLQNFFDFLDYQPKIVSPKSPKFIDSSSPLRVEFKNVSFGYEPGKMILKNVSLTLKDAKNLALVGENGAGKTTLVKLLLRLYDVSSGQILVNNVDIRDIDIENLREKIGVIFQDYMHYEVSVRENIGFGDIKRINNIGAIRKAARLSGASEFIEKFPDKYKAILGKYWEKGEELSGGQWQKIALARAFFKDAKVLIMDEPTSALDPKSEYEVFQNLIFHTTHKSLILISHRFSTVRLADEIIVMHKGEIIEQGTHEALMKKNDHYAKLYGLQAKWYK